MTDFQSRQRQSMADFRRSAFRHEPPGFSCEAKRLDAIAAEAERQRQQQEAIRQMTAEMADLIEHAKQGEFKEDDASR
jgi:hypothetical protein